MLRILKVIAVVVFGLPLVLVAWRTWHYYAYLAPQWYVHLSVFDCFIRALAYYAWVVGFEQSLAHPLWLGIIKLVLWYAGLALLVWVNLWYYGWVWRLVYRRLTGKDNERSVTPRRGHVSVVVAIVGLVSFFTLWLYSTWTGASLNVAYAGLSLLVFAGGLASIPPKQAVR